MKYNTLYHETRIKGKNELFDFHPSLLAIWVDFFLYKEKRKTKKEGEAIVAVLAEGSEGQIGVI
jgi:hypothetical protein